MYRIICAKWGDYYSDEDVRWLHSQCKRNCSVDFTFECFTEFPQHLEEYKQNIIELLYNQIIDLIQYRMVIIEMILVEYLIIESYVF